MMRHVKLSRPSPALVIAVIALIFSLAGNAGAFSRGKVTKNDLAKGAVTASALAKGAVTKAKLRKGAVTAAALASKAVGPPALANNAVTAAAIAPGSVYGYALGPASIASSPITDSDASADLSTWTNSGRATVACAPGDRILGGGVVATSVGNGREGTTVSGPVSNGATNGWAGEITSDSGGSAAAQVQALCLKAGP